MKYAISFILIVFLTISFSSVNTFASVYNYDANGNITKIMNDETEISYESDQNGNMTGRSVSKKVYNSVIANGNFNEVDTAGNAKGWELMTVSNVPYSSSIKKIDSRNHQQIQASNMTAGSLIGIKQTFAIPYIYDKYVGMKSSLKVDHLQNAEVVMALDFMDDTGTVIKRIAKKSTLTGDFFYTMSEGIGGVPFNTKKAVIQLFIQATGNNAAGSITIKGVDVTYDFNYYFNMLMNHDFQGEINLTEVGRIFDYWQYTGDANRYSFSESRFERGKRRQIIFFSGIGSKEIYLTQNILLDDSMNFQLRGILKRTLSTVSHLRISFFNQDGILLGTSTSSSDSPTDITLSSRGSIPKGAVYATIYAGARFESSSNGSNGMVEIDDVAFEYSTEPQALWNSLLALFGHNSEVALGWKKVNDGDQKARVFEKHYSGRGQKINAQTGRWGRYGISQNVQLGDVTKKSKFLLTGEISVFHSSNARLEIVVSLPYSSGKRVFSEAYILTSGERKSIRIEGEKMLGVAEAEISASLVPMNSNETWNSSILVHYLRFNPDYKPS
ncbi:hypothetical protein [Paenibacillus alvei]|uniref:hypothetical protein n=1 Tax=Paenibacillus alvei TaxID=44250 RepID=UPI00228114A4|nr:hypothetical protein [Paenibacillus alvei]